MTHCLLKVFAFFAFCLCSAASASALESAPFTTPHARVSLVSEIDGFDPGKAFRLGLRFQMAKGWHIYWLNPGDAGEPPQLDLTLPQGATASGIDWPAPYRVAEGPLMTYSYSDEVVLPLTVTPPQAAAPLTIGAKVTFLICEKICVPEEGALQLDMQSGHAAPSAEAPLFSAADRRIPHPSPYAASLLPDATLVVAGAGLSPSSVKEASFFPDKWGFIEDAAPQRLSLADGQLSLALKPAQSFDPKVPLSGVLRIADKEGAERFLFISATSKDLPAATENPAQHPATFAEASPEAGLGILTMLGFAFLGGLILNLMPCVFPILAIKALTIAQLSGHARGKAQAHAAAYTAGVLFSFAGLGVLLLGLKAAGAAAGWGFQFQSPVFVAGMAFLLMLIGLNLSGVFEISGRFIRAGSGLADRGGALGSFFTGFLAVLVATPCTAPFMGTAIAAAIAASPFATLAVLLALGLGLATPYVLIASIPGLVDLLPRPGAWMVILKQALAFPMYAATAWLVWVLSQQIGSDGVLAAATGLVLLGLAAWAIGVTQGRHGFAHRFGRAVCVLALLGTFAVLYDIAATPPALVTAKDEAEPYSPESLAALRAQGRPVFVNLTAAWCVTCKINEKVALTSEAVQKAFASRHIAYLKGDWTRADPAISALLHQHGRDGVPLYLFYPAKGEAPVILPQLLTAGIVLDQTGS
jgi:thiol:disulfide interchange protein DsbD